MSHEDDSISEEALLWVVRLHSGLMSDRDHEAYASWRSTSARHQKADEEALGLWKTMSLLHVDPSSGLIRASGKSGISRRQAMFGFAGVATTGAVTGAMWSSGLLARWTADYSTYTASIRSVDLEDGSRVTLNARSSINVNLSSNQRSVSLVEGQAYFEIAADSTRPFNVVLDGVSMTTLDARFDISRNVPGVAAELYVAERVVRINSAQSFWDAHEGQSISIGENGVIGSAIPRSTSTAPAWRDGIYVAEDRSLAEVIAALSDWYPGNIFITSSSLSALKVNAVLDLRDPLGSLEALRGGLPLQIRNVSNYLILISEA